MNAHTLPLTADRLEAYHLSPSTRQDHNSELRGNAGSLLGRANLELDQAGMLDAPNPWGFAACAVTAELAELYTAANYCN